MSFSPEWLALREPADIRARNADVLKAVAAHCAGKAAPRIADLACGTGSTFRAIGAALPAGQRWTLYDYDRALLDEARRLLPDSPIETIEIDLLKDLPKVFAPEPDLIVTSAFLDLVSAEWLDQLIGACARHGTPLYAALSYDGRASCDPPHRDDRAIIDAVNRHQRTDKGFGLALGPEAATYAIKALEKAGFNVARGQSDWLFLPSEGVVASMVIDGWAQAAYELDDVEDEILSDWAHWHMTRIADGASEIMVGHVDLFAVPKG